MDIISLLKKLPIDVGQAERKHDSAGKVIAFSHVPNGAGNKKALDIGCRDGYWSERLKDRGYLVTSLDIEPHYPGSIQHDVEKGLPFPNEAFDIVWCTEVIEHLHKPELFIREVDRIVKPGGLIVLTTPNSYWWFYKVVGIVGWSPQRLQNKDHKQFFSLISLQRTVGIGQYFGYFPYGPISYPIRRCIGLLSPTLIVVKGK